MYKLALRGVRMNVGRYVATLVAIMTGVAFFAASGFLADRVTAALEGNARDQYANVDAAVTLDPDAIDEMGDDLLLPGDAFDRMAALPEVAV